MKTVNCLHCRRDRVHRSRGLCNTCVRHLTAEGKLHTYSPIRPGGQPMTAASFDADIAFEGTWVRRGLVHYPMEVAS